MILCCGEALIDMVPCKAADGDEAYKALPGGAVFNTALALGRLSVPVGFFSGISNDVFGRKLTRHLNESGVDTSFAAVSGRPTTLAIVELTNGHASYSFIDENSAGRMLSDADRPRDLSGIDTLYFGGISLCAEPAAGVYERLCLDTAKDRLIMLDPNIRPSFITDEPAYRARIARMIAASDIVKISDEDLDWLVPDVADTSARLEAIAAEGPSVVILTRGGEGALARTANGMEVEVPGRPAQVVDTVGAGDTFNAGILASLHRQGLLNKDLLTTLDQSSLEQALDLGARVAAVTVSRAGANPPWASELAD